MLIKLHSQATTTPKMRAKIQASDEPAWALAERPDTKRTILKWRNRDHVNELSHKPHRPQTALNPAQDAVTVVLRKALLISLDDLPGYVSFYKNQLVQSAPGCKTSLHAMKKWYTLKSKLFKEESHHLTRCDTLVIFHNIILSPFIWW